MYYTSFRIQNFKGIRDTTIDLVDQEKNNVLAFVGLNESGKTTILEAIHSFYPDVETTDFVGSKNILVVPMNDRVPRHQISNFTNCVSVTATVRITQKEKEYIINELGKNHNLLIDPDTLPNDIALERFQRFENGDFAGNYLSLKIKIKVKTTRQRKWGSPNTTQIGTIWNAIHNKAPYIAYFPTFVLDFPKKIFLTENRGGKVSDFYRQTFQDILDFDNNGHTIEESIIRRVRSDDKQVSWGDFSSLWNSGDDKQKIQHVMDQASATVTQVIFGSWNKIFGENVEGKEINISFECIEGEKQNNETNVMEKTNEHDVYIKFEIKDGTNRFAVNDRSLGFRWFFSFMLFTQFRVAREDSKPVLFLFDEPASNLHAAAQQKLIDSFPKIAKDNNTLAYSTHSHYMIEPKWLEQTFIVTNQADNPSNSVIGGVSLSDESLDIKATKYRAFVNSNPNKISYFQPILDRLQVVPSRFDIDKTSIILEGKSDYYVLRYAAQLLKKNDLPLIPCLGANTFDALISLHLGWGIKMISLLDGDKEGKTAREKYVNEFGVPLSNALTLNDLHSDVTKIEDVLDADSHEIIRQSLNLDPQSQVTKKQICKFFQEHLAKEEIIPLGSEFSARACIILDKLKDLLNAIE